MRNEFFQSRRFLPVPGKEFSVQTRNVSVSNHPKTGVERRAWVRTGDHTVVFDRDPDFVRFLADSSGSVLRILRIWVADADTDAPRIRHYLGSVRRCECGGWMSHRELIRLFRRAIKAAGSWAKAPTPFAPG